VRKFQRHLCDENISLVIKINGLFALLSLVSAVVLIGISVSTGKTLDNAVLIALLVQPMGVALSSMTGLVTQSNSAGLAGTQSDPVVTTVSQPADDPIPVVNEPKE
jgi:hypothetical protein